MVAVPLYIRHLSMMNAVRSISPVRATVSLPLSRKLVKCIVNLLCVFDGYSIKFRLCRYSRNEVCQKRKEVQTLGLHLLNEIQLCQAAHSGQGLLQLHLLAVLKARQAVAGGQPSHGAAEPLAQVGGLLPQVLPAGPCRDFHF